MACGEPIRDKSHGYVAISNAFGTLAGLFVLQRIVFKLWAKLPLATDDWLTLAAMISSTPSIYFNAHVVAPNGMGRDTWTLSYDNITTFCRYFFIMEVIYFTDVALIKLALLFFYVRIFPSLGVRRLLLATIVLVAFFGLTFIGVAMFQCHPIYYYWWKWDGEHHGSCMDINAIAWSNAVISITLDVWMLGVPMWQLKNMRLDWIKKLGVGVMFSVGTFVTVVSILRLQALNFSVNTVNPTWDFFDVGVWSTVEINVGIICTCMPTLRLMLVRIFPGMSPKHPSHYNNSDVPQGAYKRAALKQQYGLQTFRGEHQNHHHHHHRDNSKSQLEHGNNPGTTSRVERADFPPPSNANQISCHTSYEVVFGKKGRLEEDEVQLVAPSDGDAKSMASMASMTSTAGKSNRSV